MPAAARRIIITGGNGFVGRVLSSGLRERGYHLDVFDRWRGSAVDWLRHRRLGTRTGPVSAPFAIALRRASRIGEDGLRRAGLVRPTSDDILAPREQLVARFRGSDVVIHLAALPHPHVPGATEADFRRVNFDGAVNVFEAAREAGVRKFVFASSGQVYGINKPVRIDQFPILESNYCPTRADGQHAYGILKGDFERYLTSRCATGGTIQAVSLRLEFPGVRSRFPWNFYISTSVENTVAGFAAAIEADLPQGHDVFNLADADVHPSIVNIQEYLRREWPAVPNRTTGHACLLGTDKARALLGYDPRPGGTYYSISVMW